AIGPGRPIDGVFEHAGNGVVVLRRGEENRIGSLDARFEKSHAHRRVGLLILVKSRNAFEIESIEGDAIRHQSKGSAQEPSVVRTLAQATGYSEYRHLFFTRLIRSRFRGGCFTGTWK